MGQKVHPFGLRLGIIQDWRSRWYAQGEKFAQFLDEDIKIRRYLLERLRRAGVARIEIERADKNLNIMIWTARPGIVIGKGGVEVDQIRKDIEKIGANKDVQISVLEVRFPELDANLVGQNIAEQLIARVPFRRAMRRAVTGAMKTGAQGIKVMVAGRLGGAEMARTEWYREGQVPLHTLRADIDYGYTKARTTFGSIGVKVWIYKGERNGKRPQTKDEALGLTQPSKMGAVETEGKTTEQILEEENKALKERQKKSQKQAASPAESNWTSDLKIAEKQEEKPVEKPVEKTEKVEEKKEKTEKKASVKAKAADKEEKSKAKKATTKAKKEKE